MHVPSLRSWANNLLSPICYLCAGPAASPAVSRSPCYLPSGVLVGQSLLLHKLAAYGGMLTHPRTAADAPDSSISSEYYYSYVTTYRQARILSVAALKAALHSQTPVDMACCPCSYSSYAINYYAYYSAGTTATPAAAPTAATPAAAPTGAAPAAAPMAAAPTQVAPTAAAPAPAPQYPVCCPTQTVQQGDTVTSLLTAASQPPGPGNSAAILFYAMNPDVTPGQPLQPGITVTVPCYRILEYFRSAVRETADLCSSLFTTAIGLICILCCSE